MSVRNPTTNTDYRRRSQLGSSHPQQPITSRKGGYLRCPFEISPHFSDLAARLVASSSTKHAPRSRASEADDEAEGVCEGRPWTRAGIDARRLTTREKLAQQTQSEQIYGSNLGSAPAEDLKADPVDPPTRSSTRDGEGRRGGGGAFAMDIREKQALQKLLPRHLRGRQERGASEGASVLPNSNHRREGGDGVVSENDIDADETILKKGSDMSKPSNKKISEKITLSEKDGKELSKGTQMVSKKSLTENKSPNMGSSLILDSNSTTSTTVNSALPKKQKRMRKNEEQSQNNSSNAAITEASVNGALPSTSPPLPKTCSRPMNKMQRLEEIRLKALFGKKKRF
ncbi:unnamed protein product [Phytomonas sp. Hart1]|nr:unnamed protein product [Phytomonas sp. Hart1]|eukprot:CCW68036.1 unnamed protein product [Phytomonas sp. isolate Hart1]